MQVVDTVEETWTLAVVEELMAGELPTDPSEMISAALHGVFGTWEASWVPSASARDSLQWIFARIRDIHPDRSLLLPAFTCPVVLQSAKRAGAHVSFYDFAQPNGGFDLDSIAKALDPVRTSAIVITHLFGVPAALGPIPDLARERGILVIEDCAHAVEGHVDGNRVGTIGDATVVSFNYDKPISLGWGGAALLRNRVLRDSLPRLNAPTAESEVKELRRFANFLKSRRNAIRPTVDRRVSNKLLRGSKRASAAYQPPETGIGPLRAALARWQLERLADTQAARNRNAASIAGDLPPDVVWTVPSSSQPAWLKLKVGMPTKRVAQAVSRQLQLDGIRAGTFNWPTPIHADAPIAVETSQRFIDVPVHQNLATAHTEVIKQRLTRALATATDQETAG